jgi:hypothetical protein
MKHDMDNSRDKTHHFCFWALNRIKCFHLPYISNFKKLYAVKNRINLQIVWIQYCPSLQGTRSCTKHHSQQVQAQP